MKLGLSVLMGLLFFAACTGVVPKPEVQKEDINTTLFEGNQTMAVVEQNVSTVKEDIPDDIELIENVFSDELYFEKDKVVGNKTKVVIKYLDALPWEKKALNKAYAKKSKLWSLTQSEAFRKILEEDAYLSLCSDRRYWDNLEFQESEPERDILQSILLMRYLNNLSHGCPQWIESKVKGENKEEHINSREVFALLPHKVIIEKLFSMYVPRTKKFSTLLEKHHTLLSQETNKEILKAQRLELESYKREKCKPEYR